MKKIYIFLFSLLLLPLFSFTYAATTQQWRDILNQLRKLWRTDNEIKEAIEDLWYDSREYFPTQTSTSNTTKTSATTQEWRDILNQLRNQWRTDNEIKQAIEDLWYDSSAYFPSSTSNTSYISRSCKTYNIKYLDTLGVYTSDNLLRQEYFINTDYFKRYIDSKNPQRAGCPTNVWWISSSYIDNSWSSDRYTAPNGKVYFIQQWGQSFTSNELSTSKTFYNISDLKYYIRDRNPLIWM